MSTPTRLNAAFVKSVDRPGRYGDGGRGSFGLALLVRPTSTGGLSKSYIQRIRVNGRETNIGLGSHPLTTLSQAREAAFKNAQAVRGGQDPMAERKRRTALPTFEEAVERVVAAHESSWKDSSRTAGIWRGRLHQYAYPTLRYLPVDAITSGDVLGVIAPIWNSKRETATKLKGYITAIFKWCIAEGHRADNPVDAIGAALPRTGVRAQHHPALPYAEVKDALAKIWESDAHETTKLAIDFLTLTAVRSGEVRGAAWTEIDPGAAMWMIPAHRMKTGRDHRVPLSRAAVATLEAARAYADGSGLVFPSVTGRVLSDSTLSKAFRTAGVGCVPHGMRTTFRTWAAECSGAPREIAEMALGHVEGSAAELAYRRTDYFEARRALMEAWAEVVNG